MKNKKTFLKLLIIPLLFLVIPFFKAQAVDETAIEKLIDNEYLGGGVAQGWSGDDKDFSYNLPFNFNFYGTDYTDIKIGSNGVICLDNTDDCTWYPGTIDEDFGPFIVPMGVDLISNIYLTENSNNIVFRWDAREYGESDQIYFEVALFNNGNIKFNYGDQDLSAITGNAVVGISKGDGVDYVASVYNDTDSFDLVQTSTWGDFPPEVDLYYPEDNEFNTPVNISPVITFDRDVYSGTGFIEIKKSSDDSILERIDIASNQVSGWGTDTITINLINDLPSSTELYINVNSGAIRDGDDLEYEGISDSSTWSFATVSGDTSFSFSDNFIQNNFIDEEHTTATFSENYFSVSFRDWVGMNEYNDSLFDYISNTGGTVDLPSFVLDTSGYPIVTWTDTSPGDINLYLSRWNGLEWTKMDGITPGYENVLMSDEDTSRYQLILDNNGNLIITWEEDSDIFITYWNGSSWTQMDGETLGKENISNTSRASYPHVVLDDLNNPIISWQDSTTGSFDIYVSRWNGSAWTQMDGVIPGYNNISNNFGRSYRPTVILDNSDNPIVSWYDQSPGNYDTMVSRWNGSSWAQMDGITPGYDNISNDLYSTSRKPTLMLSPTGNPIVIWIDGRLLVSYWNGSNWTEMDGLTLGYDIVSTSATIDLFGYPPAVFDNEGNLIVGWTDDYPMVSYWNGSDWTGMDGETLGSDILSNIDDSSSYFKLNVDNNGYPLAVWADDYIGASRWNGSDWTKMDGVTLGQDILFNESDQSYQPSIIIDDENNPLVLWLDYENVSSSGAVLLSKGFFDYTSPSIVQSTKLSGLLEDNILRAIFTAEATTPGASRIEYFLSNDGGDTWHEVTPGEEFIFLEGGTDLRWKAILYKGSTPTLESVTINYSTELEENDQDEEGEEEEEDPTIKIKSIQEDCNSLEIEISTGGEQEHEKLDFKFKIENTKTKEKTEQKIKDFKTDSHGRAILTIDNLEQNTEYKIKVKYKESDEKEYTEYSGSKKATTTICQTSTNLASVSLTPEETPISFPGELETQEEQKSEDEQEEKEQNKEEPTPTIKKEIKTETQEESPSTKGFWSTLLGGGSSDTEGINGLIKVLATAVAITGGGVLVGGAWINRNKWFGFLAFTWMKKRNWRVFDVETGEPIPDVTVILESPKGETLEEELTDNKGHFKFNASPGNNTIKVEKEGYQMIERQEKEIIEEYGEIYTGGSLNNNRDVSLNINIPMRRIEE